MSGIWPAGCWLVIPVTVLFAAMPIVGEDKEPDFRLRSGLSARTSGVDLEATASFAGSADGGEVKVDWTLRYAGPRFPLIILEPSVDRATTGQTAIVFFAKGADGRTYEYEHKSPQAPPLISVEKSWFITVEKGKVAQGTLKLPEKVVRAGFAFAGPEQFPADKPFRMWVQLIHRPVERASAWELDPWTGTLHSRVVAVTNAK